MKRNTKRLPALLLAILLCLSLLPGTARATPGNPAEIEFITLDIDTPTADAEPDNDVQAGKGDNFSVESYSGCTWYQVSGPGETEVIKGLKEGDTFEDNSWYLVDLYLIAGYGYQFTKNTTVTVSGAEQTAIEPTAEGESARAYVWFRVGDKPQPSGTISSIAITGVPIPTAGQTAGDAYGTNLDAIDLPTGIGDYQYDYGIWSDTGSKDSSWKSLWVNDEFSTEKTYRVVLDLYAADGYTFADSISNVTVNSETAYILEQGKGYAQVMLMFTPGGTADQTTYPDHVEISYAEVISAVWPVVGMTIPKDPKIFTVSSEYYTLTAAKWQRWIIPPLSEERGWFDLTETAGPDTIFEKTQYRIYAEVSVAEPWARFGATVTGSINGTDNTDVEVAADRKSCILIRDTAVYDAVYAYPDGDTSGEPDYTGVPLSINTPGAGVEATVGYYGKKDAWERVDGLYKCYTDWYEVPRVGSTYSLKRLIGASESEGTSGDHFEAGKVYLFQVQFLSMRYNNSGNVTFRENFRVQGIYDRGTGEEITPVYMEQTVNDRHKKVYNFWFTTGEATETVVNEIAVTGPQLDSPGDLDGLTDSYGYLTPDALAQLSCDQLTATFGYAYENDDGSWIVALTLEVNSGYYLGLQQNISATYNEGEVPFQVDSWDPYDAGYITITIFAGQPVSVQKDDGTEPTEYDTLEKAVRELGSETGTITLRRSYTLEKDSAVDITVPGNATLVINDGVTLTVPDNKTLALANPAFLDSQGFIAVAAGGTLKIPDSETQMTAFVGDEDARVNLSEGRIVFDLGENTLTLGADAKAEIPSGKTLNLLETKDNTNLTALDAVIETGAVLTVNGTLKAISGSDQSGSTLTVKGTLDASGGTLAVAKHAEVAVEKGGKVTLSPASLLSGGILGTADIAAGGSVSVGNEEWIGSSGNVNLTAGRMTLDFGGITTSGTIAAALTGNARAAVPTGKRWTLKVGKEDASANVDLTVETGSTLAVDGKFHVANGSQLALAGTLDVDATGQLSIGSAGTIIGSGGITNSGVLTLDKGAEEAVGTLDVNVALNGDGKVYAMADITDKLTNAQVLEDKTYGDKQYDFAWTAKEIIEPVEPEQPITPVTPVVPSGSDKDDDDDGYSVSVPASSSIRGGAVSVSPRRADRGDTVTITVKPDEGYELDELTVATRSGSELALTSKGNGRYTFTMPASDVKIQVSFREIAAPAVNPFIDVSAGAYYYDAVLWAVKNGVTNGTTATTFSPNATVTRAQMVTFLWRAHGAPRADGANPFTDVSSNAYYYDAVLWAVANGITNGTTATTFSPDAPVTRAQAVTFQWRTAGSPAVSGGSFTDVAADAYYAGAVSWAVANGITNGTTATTFSPNTPVSRAQAVTFLYRELA